MLYSYIGETANEVWEKAVPDLKKSTKNKYLEGSMLLRGCDPETIVKPWSLYQNMKWNPKSREIVTQNISRWLPRVFADKVHRVR